VRLTAISLVGNRVLQRYIATPLLLGKRKFHIRAYVLAVSALRVYLCRDCLALCSGTRYRHDDTTNLGAHITNTAFQISTDPRFCEQNCVLRWSEDDIAPILVRDGTCASIDEARNSLQTVVDRIGAITGELFHAYKSEFGVFAPIEGCFEHYGLDFLVDDEWGVYLLEVNPGPDYKQTGNKLESVIESLMGSTIDIALLPKATGTPCKDVETLSLVYEQSHRVTQSSCQ
jgi:tubulin--tyrosine ligase